MVQSTMKRPYTADVENPGGGVVPPRYAKVDEMLVASGTNQGFWSHLGCWWQNITILAVKVSFRVHSKKQ